MGMCSYWKMCATVNASPIKPERMRALSCISTIFLNTLDYAYTLLPRDLKFLSGIIMVMLIFLDDSVRTSNVTSAINTDMLKLTKVQWLFLTVQLSSS